jgi:hypothetical protein
VTAGGGGGGGGGPQGDTDSDGDEVNQSVFILGHPDGTLLFPTESQQELLGHRNQLLDQVDDIQQRIDDLSQPPAFSQQRQQARAENILSSQANNENQLARLLICTLRKNKRPVRTSFSDHEYRHLVQILDNLVTLINTASSMTTSNDDLDFYYIMFTVFPVIYCTRRRGGDKDRNAYISFLRKRSENKNFFQHAIWYISSFDSNVDADPEADEVPSTPPDDPPPTQAMSAESLKRRVEMLARKGKASQALDALQPGKIAPTSRQDVLVALQKLHPRAPEGVNYGDTNRFCPRDPDGKPVHNFFDKGNLITRVYTKSDILLAVRNMKRHAAPGLSGWTRELFVPLLKDSTSAVTDFLVTYFNKYLSLDLPFLSQHFSSNSFLFALWKVEAELTLRPLAIPCFINKLAWKLGLAKTKGKPETLVDQFGTGRPNGCQTITMAMQTALYMGKICLQVDVSCAFNFISRSKFLDQVYADPGYKDIWPLVHLNYQHPSDLVTAEGHTIMSCDGTFQGSTEATFAYSLATSDFRQTVQRLRPNDADDKAYGIFIDDTNVIMEPTAANIVNINTFIDTLGVALAEYGLTMNLSKTKIWCPPSIKLPLRPELQQYLVRQEAKCLGGRISIARDLAPHVMTVVASLITEKLDLYEKFDSCDTSLHLQHFIFQVSTVPAIDFLLCNSWSLTEQHHFTDIYKSIHQWYAAKFLGAATGEGLKLDAKSGLITQAQLEKPAGASGGGLGLPSFIMLFHRRAGACAHAPQFPWLREWETTLHDELKPVFLPEHPCPPERPGDRISTIQVVTYWWHHYVQHELYPIDGNDAAANTANKHRRAHHNNVKLWSDTRWLRLPPERYCHTIHAATFKATLGALAMYAPNFKLPDNCISKTVPNRKDCLTQADFVDHILHCSGCVGAVLIKKHNSVNYAIQKVLSSYNMGYTLEPNGLPKTDADVGSKRKYCGPDGLLTTDDGLTAVELHCSHARLWYNPKSSNYDSVRTARNNKVDDYKNFETKYPGVSVQIFTVSTGGVIHPDTIKFIKNTWLPLARNSGRGLLRALTVEIWFAIARAVGSAVQIARIRK